MKKNISVIIIGIFMLFSMFSIVSAQGMIVDFTIESNGGLSVNIQDQHTEIIDLIMHKEIDNFTLTNQQNISDTLLQIKVISVAPLVGNVICLKEIAAFYQGTILSVISIGGNIYNITLDTPLDYDFSISAFGCTSTTNMAVDGSITPVIFRVSPKYLDNNVEWDITRIIFVMSGTGVGPSNDAPDDADFGVIDDLTNGIVLRSVNGITKNIFNIKRNGEFRLRTYDVTYTDKSKAGLFSVATRRTFAGQDKNGVTIRLNAVTQDTIEVIIQDDLTGMFGMKAAVQGHIVQN